MKRFLVQSPLVSFLALLSMSLLGSFFFSSSTTHAISAQDGDYQNVSTISIQSTIPGYTCTSHDLTTSWASYITDSSKWANPADASNPTSDMSLAKASFETALTSGRWAVSTLSSYEGSGGYIRDVQVYWTEDTSLALHWVTDGTVRVTAPVVHAVDIGCSAVYGPRVDAPIVAGYSTFTPSALPDGATISQATPTPFNPAPSSSGQNSTANFFVYTDHPNYPTDYAGETIPDSYKPPADLTPTYSWTISASGSLNLTYLKNLPHFLSGTTYAVTNKMSDNWGSLGDEVDNHANAPAGWMDYDYQLPAAGYYMTRLSYDQTFESDLWPSPYPNVETVWIQYYWDGTHATSGSTAGCTGSICNLQRPAADSNPEIFNTFGGLGTPTYGLQAVAVAPLTFLSGLAAQVGHCSPITMPAVRMFTFTFECIGTRIQGSFPGLVTVYQTIITALVFYWIGMRFLRLIRDAQDPNHNSIEVLDL